MADGYGGKGIKLGAVTTEEIDKVLTEAQALAKEGTKPVLINALIGKTNFREGSISL